MSEHSSNDDNDNDDNDHDEAADNNKVCNMKTLPERSLDVQLSLTAEQKQT